MEEPSMSLNDFLSKAKPIALKKTCYNCRHSDCWDIDGDLGQCLWHHTNVTDDSCCGYWQNEDHMVSLDKILKCLDTEVEHHNDKENAATISWDRGFHNGAKTEAIRLRNYIRGVMIGG